VIFFYLHVFEQNTEMEYSIRHYSMKMLSDMIALITYKQIPTFRTLVPLDVPLLMVIPFDLNTANVSELYQTLTKNEYVTESSSELPI